MSEIDFGYWRMKGKDNRRRYRITWDKEAEELILRDIIARQDVAIICAIKSEEEARRHAKRLASQYSLEGWGCAIEVSEMQEGYFCPLCRARENRDEYPTFCEKHRAEFRRWLKRRFPGVAKLAEAEE